MDSPIEHDLSLDPAHWNVLREVWRAGLNYAVFVGNDKHPGTALEAARYDEWHIVAVGERGEVLGGEAGRFFLILDDENPRGVDVTDAVTSLARDNGFEVPPTASPRSVPDTTSRTAAQGGWPKVPYLRSPRAKRSWNG